MIILMLRTQSAAGPNFLGVSRLAGHAVSKAQHGYRVADKTESVVRILHRRCRNLRHGQETQNHRKTIAKKRRKSKKQVNVGRQPGLLNPLRVSIRPVGQTRRPLIGAYASILLNTATIPLEFCP